MNYIGKLEAIFNIIRDEAVSYWGMGFVLTALIGVMMIIIAMRDPEKTEAYKKKARVFRYCHDCPFIDMQTEVCSVDADYGEKCGLIDKTAGMTFNVTKQ